MINLQHTSKHTCTCWPLLASLLLLLDFDRKLAVRDKGKKFYDNLKERGEVMSAIRQHTRTGSSSSQGTAVCTNTYNSVH